MAMASILLVSLPFAFGQCPADRPYHVDDGAGDQVDDRAPCVASQVQHAGEEHGTEHEYPEEDDFP